MFIQLGKPKGFLDIFKVGLKAASVANRGSVICSPWDALFYSSVIETSQLPNCVNFPHASIAVLLLSVIQWFSK